MLTGTVTRENHFLRDHKIPVQLNTDEVLAIQWISWSQLQSIKHVHVSTSPKDMPVIGKKDESKKVYVQQSNDHLQSIYIWHVSIKGLRYFGLTGKAVDRGMDLSCHKAIQFITTLTVWWP